jgi:PIN domain nuclease of toxin-antitoxin system
MRLLLDTCAVIYRAEGTGMTDAANAAINKAAAAGSLFISPVSAWEIALLARPRGSRAAKMQFLPSARAFVERVFGEAGVEVVPLTQEVAFESCYLPGAYHQDPADRFLLATARALNVPIVTRDADMAAYAKAGHVKLIWC